MHIPTQIFSLTYLSNAKLGFVFFLRSESCAVRQLALTQEAPALSQEQASPPALQFQPNGACSSPRSALPPPHPSHEPLAPRLSHLSSPFPGHSGRGFYMAGRVFR